MVKFNLRIVGDLGFEFWKDIPGYEGLYQASTYGRIKSLITYKILKHSSCRGYCVLILRKNGKSNGEKVHRLIARTFLPKWKSEHSQVNHKDENKENNRVENLEWCDNIYNTRYGTGQKRAQDKLKIKVFQYGLDDKFIREWPSAKEPSKEYKCTRELIQQACTGKILTAKNFKWSYEKHV